MRPEILNSGYRLGSKLLFAMIRVASGRALPDAARVGFYRPDFYGNLAKDFTHRAMRGPSGWSVADRELMAAVISHVNECSFCIGAHVATSAMAYGDRAKVAAVLSNLDSAPVGESLRATLRMLTKLTREHAITSDDMREVLAAHTTPEQVRDALAICCAFNTTNRLADAFDFEVLSPDGFDSGAKYLLRRGYG